MKLRPHIVLCALWLLIGAGIQRSNAQENPDDKAHITPRATPTPTPASSKPTQPQQKPNQYEPPPFPGDAPGTPPAEKRQGGYDRPAFPGDAPGTSATGESSSRDSQIDLSAKPETKETAPAEDSSVLQPWDPHKAAKDVEVGQYYYKVKNYRAALERFNHALIYKPDDAEATLGLAMTQEKLDLLSMADQNYRKYLQILPNGPKSREAEAALKRIGPGVATSKASSANDPAAAAAHDLQVGESYLSSNNFDAARERFEDAVRLTPDNPLVYFRLGQALQGMQQLEPARLNFRKYLELDPKGKFAQNAKKAISDIDYILGK
ncbi:MAG TPA: tetratricopeptide repeat protein [Candidatus Angelobacter sp.]|nr:tetratricopeptide repeat protein [Candidatus Angelobacter sp.]